MTYKPDLPWKKISDYLVEVGLEKNINCFATRVLEKMQDLIPYLSAHFCIINPTSTPSPVFPEEVDIPAPICMSSLGDGWDNEKFHHYIPLNPVLQVKDFSSWTWLDWREYKDTEYVTDFIFPTGTRYTLNKVIPFMPVSIGINRSDKDILFTERDFATLELLIPHLNYMYSYHQKINQLETQLLHVNELANDIRLLSKREAEVAALLCQRLNAFEVATKLMISPRTVQTYIENIKEKLGVRTKQELVTKILKDYH